MRTICLITGRLATVQTRFIDAHVQAPSVMFAFVRITTNTYKRTGKENFFREMN